MNADELREILPPGTEITCVLRHVSRSGMLRIIDPVVITPAGRHIHIGYSLAPITGHTYDHKREGVRCHGAGMDMGMDLAYTIGRALYPEGFTCTGNKCPSNDHSNGDRIYAAHHHADGGYCLPHRWI